ncbi:MAG: CoA-binding protein [Candidatus Kerfeldbacteria bacterium]|nr:CoA-binding protein [Candidatus Kerfeldbacteria bacterium]
MIQDFFNKNFTYAVVGATVNQDKYGYRVLKDLASAGYNVAGVNPKYQEIEGIPCYSSLKDMPQKPEVAVFEVPPEAGLKLLEEAAALGVTRVWFQPGAASAAIKTRSVKLGLEAVADGSCIMVARRSLANPDN